MHIYDSDGHIISLHTNNKHCDDYGNIYLSYDEIYSYDLNGKILTIHMNQIIMALIQKLKIHIHTVPMENNLNIDSRTFDSDGNVINIYGYKYTYDSNGNVTNLYL